MTQWIIQPSYKFDLACFANMFSLKDIYRDLHPEAWQEFKGLVEGSPEYTVMVSSLNSQGFLASSALIAIFDCVEYNGDDIDQICAAAEDQSLRDSVLKDYFLANKILTPELWNQYSPLFPGLAAFARYIHNGGFMGYWQQNCLPEIKEQSAEFETRLTGIPVIEEVNLLLGPEYIRPLNTISLFLGKFAAPHGTSLIRQGFVSDIRWNPDITAAVAIHEMLHPPYRREIIAAQAEVIVQDQLVKLARQRLPQEHYPTPLNFVEENIVEGAHVYLAEKLGLLSEPLDYFSKHDEGSHVLSVIIYDRLKSGLVKESLEEFVSELIVRGDLKPGNITSCYEEIYLKGEKPNPYGTS